MTDAKEMAMKPKRIQWYERSIMFTDQMVVAIEERRKSMTRRGVVPQPTNRMVWDELNHQLWDPGDEDGCVVADPINSPFHVGDLLWVKQGVRCRDTTYLVQGCNGGWLWPKWAPDAGRKWFAGNCYYTAGSKETDGVLLNKMFMPKWAAHIWLEIVGVKVERVTEISTRDAVAEGAPLTSVEEMYGDEVIATVKALPPDQRGTALATAPVKQRPIPPRKWFQDVWTSIHGPDSWKPVWVWALTFRPVAPAGDGKGKAHG